MTRPNDREIVHRFSQTHGDRGVIHQVMSQDGIWDILAGFPLGGVYRGLDAVLDDLLVPVGGGVDGDVIATPGGPSTRAAVDDTYRDNSTLGRTHLEPTAANAAAAATLRLTPSD